MKNKIIQIGLILSLAISLSGIAQAGSISQYRVNIPFDFKVGKKLFKAGDYSINSGGLSLSRDTLLIRSKKGKQAVMLSIKQSERTTKAKESKLIFNRLGEQYVLSEISIPGVSLKLKQSKNKVRLAKNIKRVEIALTK